MLKRNLCASLAAASMIVAAAGRAQANDAASLIGGAILGGIIVNEMNKNKQRKTTTVQRSTVSSSQRETNRQVQMALNYFGYHVGTPDGVLGRNSRSGIRRYQADMGYVVDGYLDQHEQDFLLGSYQRSQASSHMAPYNQIVATQGYPGLLRTYRNEQLGIATPQMQTQQPQMAVTPAPAPMPAPVAPVATQPEPVTARADTGALPSFGFQAQEVSMRDHCDQVNVRSAANGGLSMAGQIADTGVALNEQFCLARTQAMSDGARIEATIPNMTRDQIEAQCEGLTQAIAPQIAAIDSAPAAQVMAGTKGFLEASGQPMAQLISGGKVCLGAGYRADDPEMALASAVLLAAAGQGGYGEMVSHQLREGFGTAPASPQVASSWMQVALAAAASGAAPVLGQTQERIAVLKAAGGSAVPVFPTASGN
ncbi:peptidoglycan-binding domain-containing protein [Pseudodonghicola flavimaris]|uniref:Peptidoglycan-binding domain-containing protein n=1 Tax=Pseudodonghicola flavimaris TaxID=3050036 RepID=A0ABT7F0E6_9RHOB|nr:peptidoglycan-binding domain-containing protein [Pseudodonghicola flavimaris]MDK3018086.1 peptidoglycan-binding domain-containing protein [Pseudodonghicola flavimaris]